MAKKSAALTNIEYVAARSALTLLGMAPRDLALGASTSILRSMPKLFPSLERTGLRNLEIAYPQLSQTERREIFAGTFENLGRVLGELSQSHKYTRESLRELIDFNLDETSRELYRKNKETGRGVLITTGHLGNWELLVQGFAALYEPMAYLARPLDNPKIDAVLTVLRTRFGNDPINKTHSARRAITILREGGILGILSDVNAHPKEGVFVPFFGVEACTAAGAAMLAIRADSWIYPTFCVWDKDSKKYKFVHGSVLEPVRTGDIKHDVLQTTKLYTAEIEGIIRQYPDQWMWIHKRWKTRPPGEPDLYASV
jgi:Kdo2-lipid IVA lauroyltransferase/acyltransferase